MIDLTIIIVSWNCKEYLENCLDSIQASQPQCSFEVIVVDNNSTDGTVALLERRSPLVRLIANRENVGFAAANNKAMREGKGKYFLLLNPDTLVKPGVLDVLVRLLETRPEIWAAGPTIENADGSRQVSGVRFPNIWDILVEAIFLDRLFPRSRIFGRHKELYLDMHSERPVDFVQGSCLIVRAEVVERIGGLDERFFMYFEEVDWCWRMRSAGGQVYFCPKGVVVHLAGGQLGHYDERRLVFYHKGLLRFYGKHYPRIDSLVLRLVILFRSALRLALWLSIAVVNPRHRAGAFSSFKGYAKVLRLLFSGEVYS